MTRHYLNREARDRADAVVDSVLAAREGGAVERCHTVPHSRPYTVAMHGFGVASLMLILHPNPPRYLVKAALWHDNGERWTGDTPAPAKWASKDLRSILNELESKACERYNVGIELKTEEDAQWMHSLDVLELKLWCEDELQFGNQMVRCIFDKCNEWFEKNWKSVPDQVQSFFLDYEWRRLEEINEHD